jgi:hypothetical protein
LAQQRALMCGAISLSPIRDVPFGWVYQAAGGAVAMGGLLLVINPGWTQDYLTRIRARLPGRVRDANPDRDTPRSTVTLLHLGSIGARILRTSDSTRSAACRAG